MNKIEVKTVFMFNQYASSPGIPGSTRHFNLARELIRKGIDVYIFSSNFNHLAKRNVRNSPGLYSIENVEGVNFVRLNTFNYYHNNWRRFINILHYGIKSYWISLKLAKKGIYPDVAVGTLAHPFSVAAAYRVSKKQNARFFIDIGDLWPEVFVTSDKMSEKNLMYIFIKKIMSYFYQKADKIICLTDEAKNYFKNIGCETKAILVPPGIRVNGSLPKEFNANHTDEFKVIYAGSFQPIYPLDNLIRAAKIISDSGNKNIKFVLVGNGIQKDSLKDLANQLNVNNVDFLSPLPKGELLEFLKNASAFVLIEKKASYGFPNKIIDYLSIGRPIIYASPVRHKILSSGCCIEASNDDPEDIAVAVMNIASMPESKRIDIMLSAREFLQKHHDIEIITQNFIEHLG
jgi:hypothetical protein